MTADQFAGFDCTPPAGTPQTIDTNMDDLVEITSTKYVYSCCVMKSISFRSNTEK